MGGQPCYWKILHDGARAATGAGTLTDLVREMHEEGIEIPDGSGYDIVEHLIAAETSIGRAAKVLMESVDWKKPWPPELTFKETE